MRIALDATYSVDRHPSGIAIYSQEVITGLARAYPQHRFLYCYRPKQFFRAPRPNEANARKRLFQPPLPTFHADLFHALNQRLDSRPAKTVVCTFHDLFVMTGQYSTAQFRARFTKQARTAAENSDMIIAVSEFTAGQVADLLGVNRSRIRVVAHGVHSPPRQRGSQRENLILTVGALQVRKNISRLVEAFEGLPQDWRLVLAGAPDGYGAKQILDRIEKSSSRERIQLTGYVSKKELTALYLRASIFAFPSLDEGFGIPVLEAMAHGLPVVTSNGSALAEVAGDAALLVNPEDTGQLQETLTRLIKDSEQRAELTRRGRLRATIYSWERTVEKTYQVYQEALR